MEGVIVLYYAGRNESEVEPRLGQGQRLKNICTSIMYFSTEMDFREDRILSNFRRRYQ